MEDRGLAGPEQGLCARVYLAVGKEIETARERVLILQLDWYFYRLLMQNQSPKIASRITHTRMKRFEVGRHASSSKRQGGERMVFIEAKSVS